MGSEMCIRDRERGGQDMWGEWRGTAPQQPQVEARCGAFEEPGLDCHRFSWIAHTECAVDSIRGGCDRGDDRCGVANRGKEEPPRRRTFRLTEIVPRVYHICDGSTEWSIRRRGQLTRSWWSAISDGEEAANLNEKQRAEWTVREEAARACTYCGLDLENSVGVSGDNHMRVPVPCPHGGFVRVSCMLEPADRLVIGHTDSRSCVACSCEWAGGRRPLHPAELAAGLPMTESGGRWAAL